MVKDDGNDKETNELLVKVLEVQNSELRSLPVSRVNNSFSHSYFFRQRVFLQDVYVKKGGVYYLIKNKKAIIDSNEERLKMLKK